MIDTQLANTVIAQLDKGMEHARLVSAAVTKFDLYLQNLHSMKWWDLLPDDEAAKLATIEATSERTRDTAVDATTAFCAWAAQIKHYVASERKDSDIVRFIWLRTQLTTCNPGRESDMAQWRAEMLDNYRILKERYDSNDLVKFLIFQEGYESLIEPAY